MLGSALEQNTEKSPLGHTLYDWAATLPIQSNYLLSLHFSHCWFATPQEVLHADWQEVWHSPQPPF